MFHDTLFARLNDPDIQQEVLGNENQNMTLEQAVMLISNKEARKRLQSSLQNPRATHWAGKQQQQGHPEGKCSVHPKMNHTDAGCYQQHPNLIKFCVKCDRKHLGKWFPVCKDCDKRHPKG
jgi:hypothetical protein